MAVAKGPVVLKYACFEPPQSFVNQKCVGPLFNKINKEGEGILKIETFAGGTLGRSPLQPIGLNVFILHGVTRVPLGTIYRGTTPFVIADIVRIALLVLFPSMVLWLPSLMK